MAIHVGYFVFMEIDLGMIIINKEAISSLIFIRGI